jgi:hypothetical protein
VKKFDDIYSFFTKKFISNKIISTAPSIHHKDNLDVTSDLRRRMRSKFRNQARKKAETKLPKECTTARDVWATGIGLDV